MTFNDVLTTIRNLIDEPDVDEQIDSIVKNAVNYAYLMIVSKIDKRSTSKEITYSKYIKFPNDFVSLIDVLSGDEILSRDEYSVKGDMLIFHTNRFNTMTLLYNKTIVPLVNGTDVLDIDDRYCFACAMYGAYVYSIHRKRTELASLLLNDFNSLIQGDKTPTELEVNSFDVTRNN